MAGRSQDAVERFQVLLCRLCVLPQHLGDADDRVAPTIFWGPMSYAIMGGLLVATVLTLIFLPALYVACFRVKEPVIAA